MFDPLLVSKKSLEWTTFTKIDALSGIEDFDAIADRACVIRGGGILSCWGNGFAGGLGSQPVHTSELRPLVDVPIVKEAVEVYLENAHGVALGKAGRVFNWGGRAGQFYTQFHTPIIVKHIDDAVTLSLGANSGCTVNRDGSVACFGLIHGRDVPYGLGLFGGRSKATSERDDGYAIEGLDQVKKVAAAADHACAIVAEGKVFCWGAGGSGQLGNGKHVPGGTRLDKSQEFYTYYERKPVLVAGLDDAVDIAVRGNSTCALHKGGRVSCWGENRTGELGLLDHKDRDVPTDIGIEGIKVLLANRPGFCALNEKDELWCWSKKTKNRELVEKDWPKP